MVIIMSDLNARIGRKEFSQGVGGTYTLHNQTSDNGKFVCQFSIDNNLIFKSTCYQHKNIHLETWKASDTNVVNQIDHV